MCVLILGVVNRVSEANKKKNLLFSKEVRRSFTPRISFRAAVSRSFAGDIIRDGNLINARFLVQRLSAHCWSSDKAYDETCGYLQLLSTFSGGEINIFADENIQ